MGIRNGIYVLVLVALVVAVDVLFLRRNLGVRLLVNVIIVLLFVAFYILFLRRH